MTIPSSFTLAFLMAVSCVFAVIAPAESRGLDIRGTWVGNAQGSIFGAEGSVTITQQRDEDIYGVVEGGNFLGKARFTIAGKISGRNIFGSKEGHTFNGMIYPDGTIRGLFRASDGDTYQVFLQRPYSHWGWGVPPGLW